MRYLVSAKLIPGRAGALKQALDDGSFGRGFPFGDLGEYLRECNVDSAGVIRWVETCYCREASDAALDMEVEYFTPYLHAMEIADARDPRYCKGYPHCNDCLCTRTIRFAGTPLMEYLAAQAAEEAGAVSEVVLPTRWTGWRGKVQTAEEARRNAAG
jgi:hypothetical protein